MIRVLTMAREYGAGGESIARMVADWLGWRLLDRELLKEAAQAARVDPAVAERYDERVDPWLHRLVKQALRTANVEGSGAVNDDHLFDSRIMISVCRKIIEEAADLGRCVLVGRGAQCILHGREDVFHVFLYAPMKLRLERVEQELGSQPDLEAVIRERDNARVEFIQKYFGQDWLNPYLYDLMVNTKHGEHAAAEAICRAAGLERVTAQTA